MFNLKNKQIVVIGASGLVGQELISILLERGIDSTSIIPTSTKTSAGKAIEISDNAFVLQMIEKSLFSKSPLVFQCATNEAAKEWVPIALESGCQVIDCSAVYRQDNNVPIVIPSINGEQLRTNPQLIACPNCTTIILLTAIHKLQNAFDVETITVSTYQALSGAGKEGLKALQRESRGEAPASESIFPEPCAFNVFCHESSVHSGTGLNGEEEKVIAEIHKICGDSSLHVIPTCMRVPVERVHTESITLSVNEDVSEKDVMHALQTSTNVLVLNEEGHFPTALKASGGDDVLVGHVRVVSRKNCSTISLIACGDQIRTGASLNAVRIAEKLCEVATHL